MISYLGFFKCFWNLVTISGPFYKNCFIFFFRERKKKRRDRETWM